MSLCLSVSPSPCLSSLHLFFFVFLSLPPCLSLSVSLCCALLLPLLLYQSHPLDDTPLGVMACHETHRRVAEASPCIPSDHNPVTAIRGKPATRVPSGLAVLQLPGRLDDCQAVLACVWARHCACMLAESRVALRKDDGLGAGRSKGTTAQGGSLCTRRPSSDAAPASCALHISGLTSR